MTNEETDQLAQNIATNPGAHPLQIHLATRLVQLLDERKRCEVLAIRVTGASDRKEAILVMVPKGDVAQFLELLKGCPGVSSVIGLPSMPSLGVA